MDCCPAHRLRFNSDHSMNQSNSLAQAEAESKSCADLPATPQPERRNPAIAARSSVAVEPKYLQAWLPVRGGSHEPHRDRHFEARIRIDQNVGLPVRR